MSRFGKFLVGSTIIGAAAGATYFFLEQMETTEVSMQDKDKLIAEARFLRAFIYFYLIERYGDVPLVTQSYELGSENTFSSTPFDEIVAFIDKELAAIMPSLPDYYATNDANFGHPTKAVCQALLSRMYLYAASPLFNTSNDKSKWNKAYEASKKFIDTYGPNGDGSYDLFTDPTMTSEQVYYNAILRTPYTGNNKETIFYRNDATIGWGGISADTPIGEGGSGGCAPGTAG